MMPRYEWLIAVIAFCLFNPPTAEGQGPHIRWFSKMARQVDPEAKTVQFKVIPESVPAGSQVNAYYVAGPSPSIIITEAMLKVLYPNSGELLAVIAHEIGHHMLTTQPGLFETFHDYFHRHLYHFVFHQGVAPWEPEVAADLLALCVLFVAGNPWDLFAVHGKVIGYQGPQLFGLVTTPYERSHPFPEKRIDFLRRAWQDFRKCDGVSKIQIKWGELLD